MKTARIVLVLVVGAAVAGSAQDSFLFVSLQRSSFSQVNNEMIDDCVLVQADGSFHREHQSMNVSGNKWGEVYEGRLSPADLNSLVAAIGGDEFKSIETETPSGGMHRMEGEILHMNILRPDGAQNLHFMDAAARRPYEKTLKPLLAWWKSVEKIKVPKIKDATFTGCQPEKEMFRKATGPGGEPD